MLLIQNLRGYGHHSVLDDVFGKIDQWLSQLINSGHGANNDFLGAIGMCAG